MLIQKSAELNIDKVKIHLTTLDPKIGHFQTAVNFKSHFDRKFKKIFRALKMPEFNAKCFADAKYKFLLK